MKSIVSKPWGSFEILEKESKYTVKKLIVNPGGILSLQSHLHRSEHWIVVEGEAEVTINEAILIVKSNHSIYIPMKAKHRIANRDKKTLVIIEIWFGDNLDEDDIIRYEDIYNRS